MTPLPDIVVLLNALVELARAIALYYFSGGLWSDVDAQSAAISAWFTQLYQAISDLATGAAGAVGDAVNSTIGTIQDWINQASDIISTAATFLGEFFGPLMDLGANAVYTVLATAWDRFDQFLLATGDVVQWWLDLTDVGRQQLVLLLSDFAGFLLSALGATWEWVQLVYADPLGYITGLLGDVWTTLVQLATDATSWLLATLGPAWDFVLSLFAAPFDFITALLGGAWDFLVSFWNDPAGFILSLLPGNLGTLVTFFEEWGAALVSFVSNPVEYILTAIRDAFLSWLEQLIAENW